jgi:hypothetical protein
MKRPDAATHRVIISPALARQRTKEKGLQSSRPFLHCDLRQVSDQFVDVLDAVEITSLDAALAKDAVVEADEANDPLTCPCVDSAPVLPVTKMFSGISWAMDAVENMVENAAMQTIRSVLFMPLAPLNFKGRFMSDLTKRQSEAQGV